MAMVKVRGVEIDVDIETELRAYHWSRASWSRGKLIACSPFRDERTPSFFVQLTDGDKYPAGAWNDMGADDENWASGMFVKLITWLRNETREEAEEYLLTMYGGLDAADELRLRPIHLDICPRIITEIDESILDSYEESSDYLNSRGISDKVQREAGILYDATNKAIVIPWLTLDGRLANVKYRSVRNKIFWYAKGAAPLRTLVYGADLADEYTVICEAEIDALSFREAGFFAVAVGGSDINAYKRDILLRSRAKAFIIVTDNDAAGQKLRFKIQKMLAHRRPTYNAYIGGGAKDANQALTTYGPEMLVACIAARIPVSQLDVNLDYVR